MKISILSPNLASNCVGRAYILADMLREEFDVEIVGPMFGEKIWEPISKQDKIKIKYIKYNQPTKFYFNYNKFDKLITGDVIYASKPILTSFGIGIIKKYFSSVPLVLDIDDRDISFYFSNTKIKTIKYFLDPRKLLNPINAISTLSLEKLGFIADKITVAGINLQKLYGGIIIPHARDETLFNPKNFDQREEKRKIGLSDKTVVFFFGTHRKHKGINIIIKSIMMLNRPDLIGFIGGCDKKTLNYLRLNFGKFIFPYPKVPFSELPRIISIADIVVIPLLPTPFGNYQVPAKIFDSMAMEKPIIATNVSDIPMILKDTGYIVEFNSPEEISQKILHILNHPEEAMEKASLSRKSFLENYSYSAIRKKLKPLFKDLL